MQIVIDIPEDVYNDIKNGYYTDNMRKMGIAIGNGTVLPEHGRLIDADAVKAAAMEDILGWEDAGCDRNDYRAFLDNYIYDAPTIIPADKEADNG